MSARKEAIAAMNPYSKDQPVPYTPTARAENVVAAPEPTAEEIEADWGHEWDSTDSAVHQARVEHGLDSPQYRAALAEYDFFHTKDGPEPEPEAEL
jgi:hypothetical protein